MNKKFFNSKGFSLLELMVALGVGSIVSLTVMKLNENSVKTLKRFETDSDLRFFLDGVLKSRLSKKNDQGDNNCWVNFNSVNGANPIADVTAVTPINQLVWENTNGDRYDLLLTSTFDNTFRVGNRSWTVSQMSFGEFTAKRLTEDKDGDGSFDAHSTQGTCYLNVTFQRAKTMSHGPRQRRVKIAFDCARNADLAGVQTTLSSCQIADKSIIERWTVEHDPLVGTYIQYDDSPGGFVSIGQPQLTEDIAEFGTEPPEFPLEILSSESVWYLPVFTGGVSLPLDHVYSYHRGIFGFTEVGDPSEGTSCLQVQNANVDSTPFVEHCMRTSPLSAAADPATIRESFSRYLNRIEIQKGNIFIENGNLNIGPSFITAPTNANLLEVFPDSGPVTYTNPYDLIAEKIIFSTAVGSRNYVRRPFSGAFGVENEVHRRYSYAFGYKNLIQTEANFNRNTTDGSLEPVISTLLFGVNNSGISATGSVGHRLISFGLHQKFDKATNTISFTDRQFGRSINAPGAPAPDIHYRTVEGFTDTALPNGVQTIGALASPYAPGTYAHYQRTDTNEHMIYQSLRSNSIAANLNTAGDDWVVANAHMQMGSNISNDVNAFQTYAFGDQINFQRNAMALGSFINIGDNVSDILVLGNPGSIYPYTSIDQTFNTDDTNEVKPLGAGMDLGWTAIVAGTRIRFASDGDKGTRTVAGYLNTFSIDQLGNLEIGNAFHSSLPEAQRNDFSTYGGAFSHQNSASIGSFDADLQSPYSAALFSTSVTESGNDVDDLGTLAQRIAVKGGNIYAAAFNVNTTDCYYGIFVAGGANHNVTCTMFPPDPSMNQSTIIGGAGNNIYRSFGSIILGGHSNTIENGAANNATEQAVQHTGAIVGSTGTTIRRQRLSSTGSKPVALGNTIIGSLESGIYQTWDSTIFNPSFSNTLIGTNTDSIINSHNSTSIGGYTNSIENSNNTHFIGAFQTSVKGNPDADNVNNMVVIGNTSFDYNSTNGEIFNDTFTFGGSWGLIRGDAGNNNFTGSTFLLDDSFNAGFPRISDVGPERLYAKFIGGYYLHTYDGAPGTEKTRLLPNSSNWTTPSSRKIKEIFEVDEDDIYQKVRDMEIKRWSYIANNNTNPDGDRVTSISPFAEDFYEAFKTGYNKKQVTTIDITGVAMIAMKQIYKKQNELLEELEYQKTFLGKIESFIEKIRLKIVEFKNRNKKNKETIKQLKRQLASLKNE